MRVLLDTQAFLWYVLDDPRLSRAARTAIEGQSPTQAVLESAAPEVFVSPASYWEIAIKISLNRYALTVPYETFWRSGIEENTFRIMPIEIKHTAALLTMAHHHKDPFDRLLVAQAMVEGIPLVSSDFALDAYAVKRIW